jgi:hypothetical protein
MISADSRTLGVALARDLFGTYSVINFSQFTDETCRCWRLSVVK